MSCWCQVSSSGSLGLEGHAHFLPPWRFCYSSALGVGVGWGGGGVIACGSVESYGIYTCGLFRRVGLPCGPLLECVYLHRFLRVKKRTTQFFRAGPILWFLHYYLHLLTAPARRVYLCFCASRRAEKHDFYGVLGGFQKAIFPPGHLSSAARFSCPVSACNFDNVGWAGGGGYVRNKHTGYCAPRRLVFSIIVSKSEPPTT